MQMKMLGCLLFVLLFMTSCDQEPSEVVILDDPEYLHESMQKLTDIIVHDIFSPPVASRIYTYPSIAAYEILRLKHPRFNSLAGQLNELTPIPQADPKKSLSYEVAAIHAFTTIGKALVFSEQKMTDLQDTLYKEFKDRGLHVKTFNRSIKYGKAVADHILAWADTDQYKETRTFPKYSFSEDPNLWQPTPPDYMEGIEPHWKMIRPFVLDSAQQFVPQPPTPFDTDPNSQFYKETMEVYRAVKEGSKESVEIARFWDCNPYVSHHLGHVMYATKKITPGGHWVGIAAIACKKSKVDLMVSAQTYALTTIALADAFIACWDEKYRSNLIRPETVINQHIDPDWEPLLQTPPFPEHTSGHSVISTAAATALTSIYGDGYSFVDSVEVKYGLPARSFSSFLAACQEAAISRLYGGIHYMPAITYGVEQGEKVGLFVVNNVELIEKD